MKHIRIYEEFTTNDIQVGDYVLLKYTDNFLVSHYTNEQEKKYKEFLNNNIGVVVNVNNVHNNIKIKYHDISFFIKHMFANDDTTMVNPKFVKYIGKTPEDIKIQVDSEKYNL